MKRSKKIGVLTGVLVAACVVTWAVMRTEEHKEKIKTVTRSSWRFRRTNLQPYPGVRTERNCPSIKKREMVLSGLTMRTVNFRSARRR